jgi:hypothetical protein
MKTRPWFMLMAGAAPERTVAPAKLAAQEDAGGTPDAYLQAAGLQLTQINQAHAPGRNIERVRKSETLR